MQAIEVAPLRREALPPDASLCARRSGSEAQPGDSHLVVSMEQALPARSEWLNFNRLRIRGERTVPLGPYKLLLCGKGAPPVLPIPLGQVS